MVYGKGLKITLWIIQILAAVAFLGLGLAKLAGAPMMVAEFQTVGLGQWFRYTTGLLEVVGGLALLAPKTVFYGAVLLVVVMCGALVAHFTVLGTSKAVPALAMLLLTGTIAYFRRLSPGGGVLK